MNIIHKQHVTTHQNNENYIDLKHDRTRVNIKFESLRN